MKQIGFSKNGIAQKVNLFTLLWLFGGGQIFLFISRTQGFWFEGSYGIFTGFLIMLAILTTAFFKTSLTIKRTNLGLFFLFLITLFIPVVLSEKIGSGDQDAIRKSLLLLLYVVAPSFWGLVSKKELINETAIFRICIGLLIIGKIFLFRYYSESTIAHFRAGTESNAIGLSYAFTNLWIFVLGSALLRKKILLFSFASLAAPLNIFLLSTRQSFVYLFLIIILFWLIWMIPLTIRKKPKIRIFLSVKKTKTLLLALFFLVFLFVSLQPIVFGLGKNQNIQSTFETATLRWSSFFESGYSDKTRMRFNKDAIEVWKENPLLGEFSYHETPGSFAHHMLIDFLGQFGLVGCTAYLFLIFLALKNIINDNKDSPLDISFSLMFIGLLFVGMIVTQVTTNPIFHFLLFYWVSHSLNTLPGAKVIGYLR